MEPVADRGADKTASVCVALNRPIETNQTELYIASLDGQYNSMQKYKELYSHPSYITLQPIEFT